MEKPKGDGNWINGGFFVCEPQVLDYIKEGDRTVWERSPLENLAKDGELYAYKHYGFWQPMDTLREKIVLNELWEKGQAKWKTW
jgi:glucose-1-phosphate cytidylyltransferase